MGEAPTSPAPGPSAAPATPANAAGPAPAPAYWLTRFVLLRLLGLVYAVAFLVAANQLVPLVGAHGLLPATLFLERVRDHFGSSWAGFLQLPSVFWLGCTDRALVGVSWAGLALSLVVLLGYANALMLALLWALYLSIIHIGQDWYGYGWEIQLLETGFLAIFLCPLLDGRPFPRRPPPAAVMTLFRWLIFRIMLGAGLIKLRGDPCWRNLTCLYYHYETQPLPNPLSWWLHFRPHWFHKLGALWNHVIELVTPWFVFGPKAGRHVAGSLLFSFQVILILSGNLSFLNWLTMVPILACFDDSWWERLLPRGLSERARQAARVAQPLRAQHVAVVGLVATVGCLSVAPVANLLSPSQMMNTSFNRLHLVNTYGAFGHVGRERHEVIFEGTTDPVLSDRTAWQEYEFKGQPGPLTRRPCVVAPYQYRLDWQMWFAGMAAPQDYPWTLHLIWKLLHNDPGTLGLLATNPFPQAPPRYIRARLYHYQFAPPGDPSGAWWRRTLIGEWLPPLSAADPRFRRVLQAYGWLPAPAPAAPAP